MLNQHIVACLSPDHLSCICLMLKVGTFNDYWLLSYQICWSEHFFRLIVSCLGATFLLNDNSMFRLSLNQLIIRITYKLWNGFRCLHYLSTPTWCFGINGLILGCYTCLGSSCLNYPIPCLRVEYYGLNDAVPTDCLCLLNMMFETCFYTSWSLETTTIPQPIA